MNAKEARQIAESNNNILNDSQYIKIIEHIKVSVNKGKFLIDVDFPNKKVIDKLESDGYTCDTIQSGINEYCLRITW